MEHRTQIYLEDKHYRFLKEKAQKEGMSFAQAVRLLIEKEMPKEKEWEKDPIWSLSRSGFRSGIKDGSRRHEDYLRNSLKTAHRKKT